MKQINLNADLGESFGAYSMGEDEALLKSITSANIACGFHAGDPQVMFQTLKAAKENKVSCGAHPSFPDLQGFGRRVMHLSAQEIYTSMAYQIGALQGVAQTVGVEITHVKPHGALNNMACEDADLAATICQAVKDVDGQLLILAPALSELSAQGKAHGLKVVEEIFADRAYTDKGTLVNRKIEGAVIHDKEACLHRIVDMLEKGGIITQSGQVLKTDIHSICVHGDTLNACETANFIKNGLVAKEYELSPLTDML